VEPVDENTVRKTAHLARLALDPSELTHMVQELRDILQHIHAIEKLDLEKVPATSHVIELVSPMRADEPRACLPEPLQNAPAKEGSAFKVPQVIE
jgi:aspartyl-tRNA(Asn)/glutamyl-tRNA(Gln) amidotransferase subunit C